MNVPHKILKLKELAGKIKMKPAKSFNTTEAYLEYAIDHINSKSTYAFHQYLFLIDSLYVILIPKQYTKSEISQKEISERKTPVERKVATITPLPNKKINKGMEEVKDKEYVKKNLFKVKLDWKK